MKEATKALKDSKTVQEDEIQELRALLTKTKAELKEERDKVLELEDYSARESKISQYPRIRRRRC